MKTLLIRADSNPRIGSGHMMRCLALAESWQAKGGNAIFLSECESQGIRERLKSSSVDFVSLEAAHPNASDLRTTLSLADEIANAEACPVWIVLDGYYFDSAYQRAIRESPHKSIVIDDIAHLPRYHADILLNHNAGSEHLEYHCDPDTQLLLGSEYALLRREFLACRALENKREQRPHRVLITFGGADPGNLTSEIINALARCPARELEVVVILGANNPRHREVSAFIASLTEKNGNTGVRFNLLFDPPTLPELMRAADVAISSAGTTSWELAFMGIPAILVVTVENQKRIAENVASAGATINLGWADNEWAARAVATLKDLLARPDLRRGMSDCGRALVDGAGADRVVACIERMNAVVEAV